MASNTPIKLDPPPITTQMIGQNGLPTFAWINFFQAIYQQITFAQSSAQQWSSWTPAFAGTGSMVVDAVAVDSADFWQLWANCTFSFFCTMTIEPGPVSNSVKVTLPVVPADTTAVFGGNIQNSTTTFTPALMQWDNTENSYIIRKLDNSNFVTGFLSVQFSGSFNAAY